MDHIIYRHYIAIGAHLFTVFWPQALISDSNSVNCLRVGSLERAKSDLPWCLKILYIFF